MIVRCSVLDFTSVAVLVDGGDLDHVGDIWLRRSRGRVVFSANHVPQISRTFLRARLLSAPCLVGDDLRVLVHGDVSVSQELAQHDASGL